MFLQVKFRRQSARLIQHILETEQSVSVSSSWMCFSNTNIQLNWVEANIETILSRHERAENEFMVSRKMHTYTDCECECLKYKSIGTENFNDNRFVNWTEVDLTLYTEGYNTIFLVRLLCFSLHLRIFPAKNVFRAQPLRLFFIWKYLEYSDSYIYTLNVIFHVCFVRLFVRSLSLSLSFDMLIFKINKLKTSGIE